MPSFVSFLVSSRVFSSARCLKWTDMSVARTWGQANTCTCTCIWATSYIHDKISEPPLPYLLTAVCTGLDVHVWKKSRMAQTHFSQCQASSAVLGWLGEGVLRVMWPSTGDWERLYYVSCDPVLVTGRGCITCHVTQYWWLGEGVLRVMWPSTGDWERVYYVSCDPVLVTGRGCITCHVTQYWWLGEGVLRVMWPSTGDWPYDVSWNAVAFASTRSSAK